MFNLPHVPEHISGITHPSISDMYIKENIYGNDERIRKILVIEAILSPSNAMEHQDYTEQDSYLIDLLIDLEDLKKQVEAKVGRLDEIDIRRASVN